MIVIMQKHDSPRFRRYFLRYLIVSEVRRVRWFDNDVVYRWLFMGRCTVLFTSVAGQSEVGSWTNVRARSDRGPGVGRQCVGARSRAP